MKTKPRTGSSVPLKKRWLGLGAKQLLQWVSPPGPWKARLNKAAFMGYFGHSKKSIETILKQVGFKEVQCFTVLKDSFEHYEFVARKRSFGAQHGNVVARK